jgi:multicomponent Na+:H+ antiporter subunit E
MRYAVSLTLLLVALWLGLSGMFQPLLLILGAGSVATVVWIALRMNRVAATVHDPALTSWRMVVYSGWLLKQIVLANLNVARRILAPGSIKPQVIEVEARFATSVGKVAFGNSCTLTPGTVTLQLTPTRLIAHCLDDASAEDLRSGQMARYIAWVEGREASR